MYIGISFDDVVHVCDDIACDSSDVGRPSLPIISCSDFVDEFGEYFSLIGGKEFELSGNANLRFLLFVRLQNVASVFVCLALVARRADDEFARVGGGVVVGGVVSRGVGHVQSNGIDLCVEVFVVCSQGAQDAPNFFETVVFFEGFAYIFAGAQGDGQNDVAIFFPAIFAASKVSHDASDRLDDVDLRFFRRHKDDGIERGDVDAFREASNVCQNFAYICIVLICIIFAQPS